MSDVHGRRPAAHQSIWRRPFTEQRTQQAHLDLVKAQVVQLNVAVEVEACRVAEQVRKVHDPLVDLHHLWLRCRLLLL